MSLRVAILGATAYSSRELIRVLISHPDAKIVHLGGRREGAPHIAEIFPMFAGLLDLRLGALEPEELPGTVDVAFFTLSQTVSMQYVPKFLDAGVLCIDFSADYRFFNVDVYEQWYGVKHANPKLAEAAVYGIPELFRNELRNARLVANPGCYPTAALLALAPLVRTELLDPDVPIIIDAKSGVSGRGNKLQEGSLYCDCNENVNAYAVEGHRHEPEIAQGLSLLGLSSVQLCFVPHLVPLDRGILATVYVRVNAEDVNLQEVFEEFYASEPFIRIKRAGCQPRTKDVSLTNFCDIAVTRTNSGYVVVTAAIDNLMKGAASQAVQNMNVACGIDERTGLWHDKH